MNTFLLQPEATFYHVTTIENWEKIQLYGLHSIQRKIFVSRVGELPVLLAICLEQLPEIYTSEGIVFLKLPQKKNNFTPNDIIQDNQAPLEWTQIFQNIILKQYIPIESIELINIIFLGNSENERECRINYLAEIARSGQQNYQKHYITNRANELQY